LALGKLAHLSTAEFRVSNSIQIQNSRRAKLTTSRALSPIPRHPQAPDLFAYKKTPALNAGVFFMRLELAQYAAFRLVPAAWRAPRRFETIS